MEEIKIPTLDERIAQATKVVEEMTKRDKTDLSFVDIYKPYQWLYHLWAIKTQLENGK